MLVIPTCTIRHSLIGVDALVEITAIEEILQQFLNLGDTSGATHQDDVMDLRLVHLGIPQSFFHRFQGSTKQVAIELFKTGPGDGSVEISSFEERVNLDAGLGAAREGALGTLASCAQTTHSTLIVADFLFKLSLEFSNKVVDHAVVEVFTAQVSVTGSGLDFKDAIFNSKDRHVKSSTSEVKYKHITFTPNLQQMVKRY